MIGKLTYSNTVGEIANAGRLTDIVPNTPSTDAALPTETAASGTIDLGLPMDTAAPLMAESLASPVQPDVNIKIINNRIAEPSSPDVIIARPMEYGVGGGFGGGGGGAVMPEEGVVVEKKNFNLLWLALIPIGYIAYKSFK